MQKKMNVTATLVVQTIATTAATITIAATTAATMTALTTVMIMLTSADPTGQPAASARDKTYKMRTKNLQKTKGTIGCLLSFHFTYLIIT
ncbi:hypothetical protein [Aminipila terrae]|uniref:Uncharacterized protein n=1 Tax=Aminipila terrae TaxID=2697030 RepID=A0A6P1MHR5_9FIRM|nr:hypothetical protein [Aminipila terrae]QHI73602.1 hypothetical protein Ami3637_15565 [Aminipila terrae]